MRQKISISGMCKHDMLFHVILTNGGKICFSISIISKKMHKFKDYARLTLLDIMKEHSKCHVCML